MRDIQTIKAMLDKVESTITEDADTESPERVIADTLVWVLHDEVSAERITDYLPE